jgi:diketogulonate reductase-like aldo/keto reductase
VQQVTAHGVSIPAIGLGTWRLSGADCEAAVAAALSCGYRHIDTAQAYANEAEIGAAIRTSGLKREELFITTKVWYDDIGKDRLPRAAEQSLTRLGVAFVDLLLIHWPNPLIPLRESIEALCRVRADGLTRAIGVSNFPARLLAQAWEVTGVPLVVNQCEYHPLVDQHRLLAACRQHGMVFTAYCPLGRGHLFSDPVITAIARNHRKTPAQVILRWHLQQPGVIAIPKSAHSARLVENMSIFNFALAAAEMKAIFALRRDKGRNVDPSWAPDWDR